MRHLLLVALLSAPSALTPAAAETRRLAAQMHYTEAVATFNADILVALPEPEALDLLAPLYAFCKERGYNPEGEAVRVEDWPVQFIPVFSPLREAAIREAETAELDGTPLRVVRAHHLACIALSVGRAKDFARVLALRESGAITDHGMAGLADRFGLCAEWQSFKERFGEE